MSAPAPQSAPLAPADAQAAVEAYAASLADRIAASRKSTPGDKPRPCLQLSQLVATEMPPEVRALHGRPSDVMRAFPARFYVTRSFACTADEETAWVAAAFAAASEGGDNGVALEALSPPPPPVLAKHGSVAAALAAWPSELRVASGRVTVTPVGPGAGRASVAPVITSLPAAAAEPSSPGAPASPAPPLPAPAARRPLPSPRPAASVAAASVAASPSPRAGLPQPRTSASPAVDAAEAERLLALCAALRGARNSPTVAELLRRPPPSWAGPDAAAGRDWRYVTLRYEAQASGVPLLRLDRVWVTLQGVAGRWAAVVVALAAPKRGRGRGARTAVLATDPLPRDGLPAAPAQPEGSPAVTLVQRLVGADASVEALEQRLRGSKPPGSVATSSRASSQSSLATAGGSSGALADEATPRGRRRSRRSGRARRGSDGAAASPEQAPAGAESPPVPSPSSPSPPSAANAAAAAPSKASPAAASPQQPQQESPAGDAAQAAASPAPEPQALPDIVPSAVPEGEENENGDDVDDDSLVDSATETEDDEGDDGEAPAGASDGERAGSPPAPRAPRLSARPPRIPSWDLHDADAPDDE